MLSIQHLNAIQLASTIGIGSTVFGRDVSLPCSAWATRYILAPASTSHLCRHSSSSEALSMMRNNPAGTGGGHRWVGGGKFLPDEAFHDTSQDISRPALPELGFRSSVQILYLESKVVRIVHWNQSSTSDRSRFKLFWSCQTIEHGNKNPAGFSGWSWSTHHLFRALKWWKRQTLDRPWRSTFRYTEVDPNSLASMRCSSFRKMS